MHTYKQNIDTYTHKVPQTHLKTWFRRQEKDRAHSTAPGSGPVRGYAKQIIISVLHLVLF